MLVELLSIFHQGQYLLHIQSLISFRTQELILFGLANSFLGFSPKDQFSILSLFL